MYQVHQFRLTYKYLQNGLHQLIDDLHDLYVHHSLHINHLHGHGQPDHQQRLADDDPPPHLACCSTGG